MRTGSAWGSPISAPMREHMQAIGVTREEVEMVVRGLEPLGPPAIEASRVLLQGGRWDRLATADSLADLGRRWPGAALKLYDGGHISMAIGNRWLEDASEFVSPLARIVGERLGSALNHSPPALRGGDPTCSADASAGCCKSHHARSFRSDPPCPSHPPLPAHPPCLSRPLLPSHPPCPSHPPPSVTPAPFRRTRSLPSRPPCASHPPCPSRPPCPSHLPLPSFLRRQESMRPPNRATSLDPPDGPPQLPASRA